VSLLKVEQISVYKNPLSNEFFSLIIHQNRCRLGLHPWPQWGSLQCSLRPPSWLQGGRFAAGGEWRGGKDYRGGEREIEGKGGMVKGGEKEKLGE